VCSRDSRLLAQRVQGTDLHRRETLAQPREHSSQPESEPISMPRSPRPARVPRIRGRNQRIRVAGPGVVQPRAISSRHTLWRGSSQVEDRVDNEEVLRRRVQLERLEHLVDDRCGWRARRRGLRSGDRCSSRSAAGSRACLDRFDCVALVVARIGERAVRNGQRVHVEKAGAGSLLRQLLASNHEGCRPPRTRASEPRSPRPVAERPARLRRDAEIRCSAPSVRPASR